MKKVKKMNPDDGSQNPDQPTQDQDKKSKKYQVGLLKRHVELSVLQLVIFGLAFAAIGGYALIRTFAVSPADQQPGGPSVTQFDLRFKANATKAQRDNALRNNNLNVVKEIPQIGVKVVDVPAAAAAAVKNALSHNPAIDFVEQDQVIKPQEQLPNDPYILNSGQWNISGGAWGWYTTHTTQAWDITQGNPAVNVAILDTGIKTTGLSDFDGQISSTWNVMNNTTDATSGAGNHGTYVAGVVGLAVNNGVGNAGFCPKCKMMIVQVGTDSGASWSNIAAGLTYAADHGAKVANLSWAGATDSSTLSSATTYAHNHGMVVFAAAGNSNSSTLSYPAADPYVLGVAGVSGTFGVNKAGDSNYGTWVKVAAPEGNVTSWPTINGQPGYASFGGTSSASPVAAGIAGLLFSYNSALTNAQVEQALESTAIPVNFSVQYGQVDALAALKSLGASDPQPSSAPVQTAAPSIYYEVNGSTTIAQLTGTPQVGQVLIRGIGGWTGTAGLAVSNLQWQRCNSSGLSCINVTGGSTYTVQSADAGSTLKLGFNVGNSVGSTPASALTGVVGGTVAPPPTVSLATSPSSITAGQSSTLSWSSTNSTSCTASGAWSGSQTTSGSLAVSPTSNATYTLTCTGSGGNTSSSASVLVSPATTPPATPTGLAPTPLDSAVTLTWNANTETDLAGYQLQYKPSAGSTWTLVTDITGLTYKASGLTNATSYDFQLQAINTSNQTSAWTATVSATPQTTVADTTPPTVIISAPANGSSITGLKKVNISASATDNNVVIKLELYIDGQLKTTVTTTSLSYNWTINKTVQSGSHTITVKAYDAANNIGQSSVSVTK